LLLGSVGCPNDFATRARNNQQGLNLCFPTNYVIVMKCTASGTIGNIIAACDFSVFEERLSLGSFYIASKSKALCTICNDTTTVLKHSDIRRLSNLKFNRIHIPGVTTG